MQRIRTSQVASAVVAATTAYDVDVPLGASGLVLNIDTSVETDTGSYTVTVSRITPMGNAIALIVSAAITTETGSRISVLPGVIAVTNVNANDAIGDRVRVTLTRTTGGFTFNLNADWYI